MSVQASIEIAQGMAHRTLAVHRLDRDDNLGHDHDTEYEYEVFVASRSDGPYSRHATFKHRYGDDVTILIAKAGEAIRQKYGNF